MQAVLGNYSSILIFITLSLSIVSFLLSLYILVKLSKLFNKVSLGDIEGLLVNHNKALEIMDRFKTDTSNYLRFLDKRVQKKTAKVELVRYNAFEGAGLAGSQSFSLAMLDEGGNGIVVSSLHTRDRTNFFVKAMDNWKSVQDLSEEEKLAISKIKDSK